MNTIGLIISLLILPWPYTVFGAAVTFIVGLFLNLSGFKRISGIADYFLIYAGMVCYCEITSQFPIIKAFAFGAAFRILLTFLIGGYIPAVLPFKRIKISHSIQPYIAAILISFLTVFKFSIFLQMSAPIWVKICLSTALFILFTAYKNELENVLIRFKENSGLVSHAETSQKKLKVLLADISPLWTRQRAVITLEDLAHSCWQGTDVPVKPEKEWNFTKAEIIYFWKHEIVPTLISKEGKNVIGNILEYLDKHGDCPSVIADQSKNYKLGNLDEKATYEILVKRTLSEHSLQVAKELIRSDNLRIYLEKLMIAALAHDLGKIIGQSNIKSYVTGEHPKNSVYILETEIAGFSDLKYAKEVSQIIIFHHSNVGEKNPLIKIFKDLDASARRYEVESYIKEQKRLEQDKNLTTVREPTPIAPINSTTDVPLPPFLPPAVENTVQEPVYIPNFMAENHQHTKPKIDMFSDLSLESGSPDIIDIPWFDPDKFILEVQRKVNKIERGWFSAVTVNGNMVLVLTTAAWKIIQIQARIANINDIPSISDTDLNSDLKKTVLMSVVEVFRDKGVIDDGWIKKGYFNGKFELTDTEGNKHKDGWFIPFRFDAFERFNTYSEYENRKEGDFQLIVNARVPKKDS